MDVKREFHCLRTSVAFLLGTAPSKTECAKQFAKF